MLGTIRNFLFNRQRAYQATFNSEMGKVVLADLARFCRAHESTFHRDVRLAANLDGRREVFLRIAQHLELDSETLWQLYGSDSQ